MIDVRALRREFLQLQAAAHPDFHHHAASADMAATDADGPRSRYSKARMQAEAMSALINEAYKTLSSPLLRAQYLLLSRHGTDLAGDEAGTATESDPELLMAVLEAREEIEGAETEGALQGVAAENDERILSSEEVLARAFAEDDIDTAKAETVRLRYWVNIRDSLANWEPGKHVVLQH